MDKDRSNFPRFGRGLSFRLLVLATLFVMLSALLFFTPSVIRYRMNWLEQKLGEGHLAILAQRATRGIMLEPELENQLLDIAGLKIVTLTTIDGEQIVLRGSSPAPLVDKSFHLGNGYFLMDLADLVMTFTQEKNRTIKVTGKSPRALYATVEVVLNEGPLRQAIIAYCWQLLRTLVFISLVAGALLYGTLQWLAIRPMRLLTARMVRFQENPEGDEISHHPLSNRSDELGLAGRTLSEMQRKLQTALKQKTRLAALGTAVTKINHDLRGILATARLVADRLGNSGDPQVKKAAPRLVDSLDRAVAMCSDTLNFARENHILPHYSEVDIVALHEELRDDLSSLLVGEKQWLADFGGIHKILADRDQLHRVLFNLGENALQMGAHMVAFVLRRIDDKISIDVRDDGPGLPPRALEHLFIPFKGSTRAGGTGLGLAIAREAMRSMKGDIRLVETGPTGTIFRLELPDRLAKREILPLRLVKS